MARQPNYISQDEDNQPLPSKRTTRSASDSIIQEAMLSCLDIYKPQYVVSPDLGILNYVATAPTGTMHMVTPEQMLVCRIPMTWFRKMANSVIGDKRRTLGVSSPHSKPCHMGNLAALVWKQDLKTRPGDARLQRQHQHHRVHQEEPGPSGQSQ
jgi:hypothetical protein